MKANPERCHLLVSSTSQIERKVDNKLRLNAHVEDICKKVSSKIHALASVIPYMTILEKLVLMNAFFKSQFSYCPLVWISRNKTLNIKISRLHERCLRNVYNDKRSSFQNLLDQGRSDSVHTRRNLQARAIEVYKVSKGIARKIFADIFSSNSRANYDLHYQSEFSILLVKSVFNGAETISYLVPRIWDLLPLKIKQEKSLAACKKAIKIWNPHNCPCRLWKKHVAGIGFI